VTGLVFFYGEVREHFSPTQLYKIKLTQAENEVVREQMKVQMALAQLQDYQVSVAQVLPESLPRGNDSVSFQVRSIASVNTQSLNGLDTSSVLLERGKSLFRDQKYPEAQQAFQELIKKHPSSPSLVQAYFFKAESYFLTGEYAECLDVVEKMLQHYPSHELTGFILLRQGQIFALRDRGAEALEVFRLVRENFKSNKDLVQQASILMEESVL
jgi:TolA-binding protein